MSDVLREKLKKLVEKERKAEMEKQEKEISFLSGKERENKGRAVLGLRGSIIGEELGYKLLKVGRNSQFVTEIAVGNEVLISKGNPLKKRISGTITAVGNRFLVAATKEVPPLALKELRVDLYVDDTTYQRMKEALENITEQGERVLGFFQGKTMPVSPEKEEISFLDDKLNKEQREAVAFALGADDFFLMHGPFGTGKTKTISEVILQEVKRGSKILATAESNVAVDNLVEELSGKAGIVRIGHPARVSERLKKHTLSYLVENDKGYSAVSKLKNEGEKLIEEQKKHKRPIPARRRGMSDREITKLDYLHKSKKGLSAQDISSMAKWISLKERADGYFEGMRAMEREIAFRIINEAKVVLSTNSSAAMDTLEGIGLDVAIIDEASQTTLPSTLIPLSKCPRFVLAGDHKQLPPTIISREAKDLGITLFEVLIGKYPSLSKLLNIQYRMNKTLMEFPGKEFYKGKIKPFSGVENIGLLDLGVKEEASPLLFIDTASSSSRYEDQKKDSSSYYNKLEADIVEKVVLRLLKKGVKEEDLGVISPYEDQVELLRRKVSAQVNTVDGYQGQEREVIILSLVRSNRKKETGFLKDRRRLNVSLTRAKRKLIIVGDSGTLSAYPALNRLFQFVRDKGTYLSYEDEIVL